MRKKTELMDIRKLLLIHKMLHHFDAVPDIKLNISSREQQLFKPLLKIFQNTKSFEELRKVVSEYLNKRREGQANAFHAFVYRTIIDLIKNENEKEQSVIKLESKTIWEEIKANLEGEPDPNRSMTYNSEEYGPITQTEVTNICLHVLGAVRPKHKAKNKELIFNADKLKKLEKVYDIQGDIQVVTVFFAASGPKPNPNSNSDSESITKVSKNLSESDESDESLYRGIQSYHQPNHDINNISDNIKKSNNNNNSD
jgi:hypothetical protein